MDQTRPPAAQEEEELLELLENLTPAELAKLERELKTLTPADELGLSAAERRRTEKVRKHVCFDFSRVENAARQIKALPKRGESIHCLMGGEYNGSDLVPAVQSLAGAPIDELYVATLGFNKTNTAQLCGLIDDGVLRRLTVVCSHYFRQTSGDTYAFAEEELAARGQRIVATRNHAKLLLFRIGRARYVNESSANLRSCNNLEQFTLCRSDTLYRFHRRWLEQVVAHGSTNP